ncbi:hypothetical protein GIB67_042074 [Kingdonia uniflora]|uniref:Uncharacterized protein n=1 Tax=Kingdonia uniflora TaxID=39325 RepID=A0A7J7MVS5_9MAGN|nr:hypothetical protein GIB67_042074 [Kingdonia uniflora]
MINLTSEPPPSTVTAEKAFSFIKKGWREVKDSADADLQLMRARANSFNREFENLLNWPSSFSSGSRSLSATQSLSFPPSEIDFVKRLQPKLSEFRRVYSSPDFSKKVLEKLSPRSTIRINLSAIKNAIVSEVEDGDGGGVEFGVRRAWKVGLKDFRWEPRGDDDNDGMYKEWEPIKSLKTRLREFENKSSSSEIFDSFKNSEFVEKVKLSLKSVYNEPQELKEVPPLDVPELLAYFVKQTSPLFDQLGFKRGCVADVFLGPHPHAAKYLGGSVEAFFVLLEFMG